LNLYSRVLTTFTIGQVAERTGFPATTLRYYGELGLVSPAGRTDSGYRVYDEDAVERLAFIGRAKQLGCTLDEIADLLAVWDQEQCGPVQRRFHDLITAKIRETYAQIAGSLAFAAQLQAAARRLDSTPLDGPCGANCACLRDSAEPKLSPEALLPAKPTDPPIACTLPSSALPDRVAAWHAALSAERARSRTSDGRLRIVFDTSITFSELAALVAAEQECCSFFSFVLTFDNRGMALEVDAPEAAREIVDAMFGTPQSATAS
jgi:DNA-binding transcriptional MerR regulator